MISKYPNLLEAIRASGATHRERAGKFNVTERTVKRWLGGETQPRITELLAYPPAIEALQKDANALSSSDCTVYDTRA